MAILTDYFWITVVGGLAMFMTGFGIGANDVANNFGSAVGGKAISLGKAIILAAICEFVGAVVMGAQVTIAIRGNIVDMNAFTEQPDVVMYGNLCALIGAGVWLLIATHFGMPVSTTHSIVGALIGFGVASGRARAVKWEEVGLIVASWFVSPLLSLVISMSAFAFLRWAILRRPDPVKRGLRILWLIIFVVCLVFAVFLVFSKNPMTLPFACRQTSSKTGEISIKSPCSLSNYCQTNIGPGIGIAVGLAVVLSLIFVPIAYYYTRRHLNVVLGKERESELVNQFQLDTVVPFNDAIVAGGNRERNGEFDGRNLGEGMDGQQRLGSLKSLGSSSTISTELPSNADLEATHQVSCTSKLREKWSAMPWNQDLHAEEEEEEEARKAQGEVMHKSREDVELFDPKAESFFSASQVISACCLSLAHGANDVANGTGPYAAIIAIYTLGTATTEEAVPIWVMLLGGASIAIGLALMGHKVIRTIGIKMIKVTPSRGVVSDLATALTVILFSFKVPLSSTHCKVGSNLGIGLIDKSVNDDNKKYCGLNFSAINWKLVGQIAFCWVITLAFAGSVSAALFAFGSYGPTLQRNYYQWNGPGTAKSLVSNIIEAPAAPLVF